MVIADLISKLSENNKKVVSIGWANEIHRNKVIPQELVNNYEFVFYRTIPQSVAETGALMLITHGELPITSGPARRTSTSWVLVPKQVNLLLED